MTYRDTYWTPPKLSSTRLDRGLIYFATFVTFTIDSSCHDPAGYIYKINATHVATCLQSVIRARNTLVKTHIFKSATNICIVTSL